MSPKIKKFLNFFLDKKLIENDFSIEKLFEIKKNFKLPNKIGANSSFN